MAAAISRALRLRVPLNSRCSRKCDVPASRGLSSREPTPAQMPNDTERTLDIASEITRRPPGRTVRRTTPPSAAVASVLVVLGLWNCLVPCSDAATGSPLLRVAGRVGGAGLVLRGLVGLAGTVPVGDRDERELAARVDLGELDLHLVADLQDVLDRLDPLAAGQLAHL